MPEGGGNPEIESAAELEPVYDLITSEEVEEFRKKAQQVMGVDLSGIKVTVTRPGEELFDRQEIQFKLLTEKCGGGDWDKFEQTYGFIDRVPIGQLKEAVQAEGVNLDGSLPGFALTQDGSGEIVFLAVADKNAITLAKNYARRNGDEENFMNSKQAVDYLRSLSKVALAHEFAHVQYQNLQRNNQDALYGFNNFVDRQPVLQDRVRTLQADKYGGKANVPLPVIREEAYADMMGGELMKNITGKAIKNRINVGFHPSQYVPRKAA